MAKLTQTGPVHANDGQTVPNMQKVGPDLLRKAQSIPAIQPVLAPRTGPASSGPQTTGQGSNPSPPTATPLKK